jgi:hypothetical protein
MEREELLSQVTREIHLLAKMGLREESASRKLKVLERCPTLRTLPAVRAAAQDSNAEFEYLIQSLIDAIENIENAGSARDGTALRAILGLSSQLSRSTWRARQTAAAQAFHVSWEHFRHGMQTDLLRAVSERLLSAAELNSATSHKLLRELWAGVVAFPTQADIEATLISYIHDSKPPQAEMLELSCTTVLPILRALCDVGTEVRLLVTHPDIYPPGWQRDRIEYGLANLFNTGLLTCSSLHVKFYQVPASLRGRMVGDVVSLGWYTHRDNQRLGKLNRASDEVWGHDNLLVAGSATTPQGELLAKWFSREYDRLWHHRLTHDGNDIEELLGLAQ